MLSFESKAALARRRQEPFRQEAQRTAVESLDNDTITLLLQMGEMCEPQQRTSNQGEKTRRMVGTGRFELPTPRTPSECSTRLSHVPTRKDSTGATNRLAASRRPPGEGLTLQFYTRVRRLE